VKLYKTLRGIVRFYFHSFFKWKITGKENVPSKGAIILISNHISNYDPLAVACAVDRQVHFMAKEELFKNSLLNKLLQSLGQFPVKRGGNDRKAIKTGLQLLREEEVLGIFPEGTRIKGGELGEGLPGAALFALKSEAAIIPIGIVSSYKWFSTIHINIGEPISVEQYKDDKISSDQLKESIAYLMKHIGKQIDEVKDR